MLEKININWMAKYIHPNMVNIALEYDSRDFDDSFKTEAIQTQWLCMLFPELKAKDILNIQSGKYDWNWNEWNNEKKCYTCVLQPKGSEDE